MILIVVIVPRWQSGKRAPAEPRQPLTPEAAAKLRALWAEETELRRQHPDPPIWPGCLFTLLVLLAIISLIVWAVTP